MYKQNIQLLSLIDPVVSAMGYELLGIEHLNQGRYSLLRLYIDNDQGITLSDCERVSHQVTGLLDVEDLIKGTYNLEVSSPGLDRPLFTLAQFGRHLGEDVTLKLSSMLEGRKKLQGRICEVGDEYVLIESDGKEYKVPANAIQQAHIVAKIIDQAVLNKREH
jgi:ribosome maturation factor RimP